MEKEIYEKIIKKKEFSNLVKKDVEIAFSHFDDEKYLDEEKIKLTRDLLRKVFAAFGKRVLRFKDKDPEYVLKKHLSTRERLEFYSELYSRLLKGFRSVSIIDLGAGVNGFSYKFFPKKVDYYVGIESVGQLVKSMNYYFKTRGLQGMALQESLFELEKIKKYIKQVQGEKIIFLFKTLDSLEMLEKNYSKKLLKEVVPLVERVVVSFAMRSLKVVELTVFSRRG